MASTEHQQLRIPLLTDSEGSSGSWGLLDASGVSSLGGPVEAEAHAVASRLWCTCLAGLAGRRLDRLINSRWFYRGVALWLLTALAVGFAGSHYFTEGFRLSVLPPARNERLKDAWNHGPTRPLLNVVAWMYVAALLLTTALVQRPQSWRTMRWESGLSAILLTSLIFLAALTDWWDDGVREHQVRARVPQRCGLFFCLFMYPTVLVTGVIRLMVRKINLEVQLRSVSDQLRAAGYHATAEAVVEGSSRQADVADELSRGLSDTVGRLLDVERRWAIAEDAVTLDREIGQGSFGVVWEATADVSDQPVAVKSVSARSGMGPAASSGEFAREAKFLRTLHHRNVLLFHGVVNVSGSLSIVTELAARGSLADVLADQAMELLPARKLAMILDTAMGLHFLHTRNPPLAHRDLKSDNLLVTDQFVVKVADFGHARKLPNERRGATFRGASRPAGSSTPIGVNAASIAASSSGIGRQGAAVDSPRYMTTLVGTLPWQAPELLRGDHDYSGFSIDVFSFGVIISEIVTRRRPYHDSPSLSRFRLRDAILAGLRPTVDDATDAGGVPEGYLAAMRQCWSHDPDGRPCIEEVVQGFEALQGAAGFHATEPDEDASTEGIVHLHLALVGASADPSGYGARSRQASWGGQPRDSKSITVGEQPRGEANQPSDGHWVTQRNLPPNQEASWERLPLLLPCFSLGTAYSLSRSRRVRGLLAVVLIVNVICGLVASQTQAVFLVGPRRIITIAMFATLAAAYSLTVILQLKPKTSSEFRWEPVTNVAAVAVMAVVALITDDTQVGLETFLDMAFVMAMAWLHGAFRDAKHEIAQTRRLARIAAKLRSAGLLLNTKDIMDTENQGQVLSQLQMLLSSADGALADAQSHSSVLIPSHAIALGRVLGRGSPGRATYHAVCPVSDRPVAVKFLEPNAGLQILGAAQNGTSRSDRLATMVQLLSSIRHRNIVLLHGFGEIEGALVAVSEFVNRGSLRSLVQAGEPKLTEHRERLLAEAAAGLAHLHDLSPPCAHGAIKTSSMLVTDSWVVKVADFGTATSHRDLRASRSSFIWLAPEFLSPVDGNDPPGTRALNLCADVYSFGVAIYEVVSGRLPYAELGALTDQELCERIVNGSQPRLPEGDTSVPHRMLTLQLACVQQLGARRPRMDDVCKELMAVATDVARGVV